MIPELGHQRRKLYLIRAFGTASTLDGYREAALRLIWRLIAALPQAHHRAECIDSQNSHAKITIAVQPKTFLTAIIFYFLRQHSECEPLDRALFFDRPEIQLGFKGSRCALSPPRYKPPRVP